MKRLVQIEICIWGLLSFAAPTAHAAFDFSFFRLRTGILDFSGPSTITDLESIDVPQNPVHVLQDTGLGSSFSRSMFDVSWLEYTGIFDLQFEQHIENAVDHTATVTRWFEFFAGVDLIATVEIDIEYSSAATDLARFDGFFAISNLATDPTGVLSDHDFRGGTSWFQPAAGSFTVNEQILIPAGSPYRIRFTMTSDSTSSSIPMHAPIEISGHANLSLMPVPEPSSALLLAFAGVAILRRRRPFVVPRPHP
ncbi:MAG: PEP-CTERM sorting domain-containing protein [Phycisphaerales bacterium]|nr:PEP-CTERM sorting domain-containing protein [Phycisphaerales bacterium]MCB9864639.1 PEP-CTERM sorting domain-containing protein [Phycisphaerales bacterium]